MKHNDTYPKQCIGVVFPIGYWFLDVDDFADLEKQQPGACIMTPSIVSTPRVKGAIAFFEGKGPEENPYSPLRPEFHDWLNGYECEIEFISDAFDAFYGLPWGSA